ncbi:MAG: hypothetical protein AAF799_02985 [Myxococcota bacterium]
MTVEAPSPPPSPSATRRLLHRWLVQYNPLYLLSAALVLVGVILSSMGLAGGGTAAQLGVTAVAEVYAWALIGSAALLVKMGQRRPALMLILLTAVYQCDLTLHTETCVYLGLPGVIGSALWWVGFAAKLRAMVTVMKVRLSLSALFVPLGGAALIATVPWALRTLEPTAASSVLGVGLFALSCGALWTARCLHSRLIDGEWAATVAGRSIRAIWIGWAGMVLAHVGFWFSQNPSLEVVVLVPVALLASTRFIDREFGVWFVVVVTLGYMGIAAPSLFALTAVMAAFVLVLRALRRPTLVAAARPSGVTDGDDVYRKDPDVASPIAPPRLIFRPEGAAARERLLSGAAGCLYLALWAWGWSGGDWPQAPWWLLGLLLVVTAVVLKKRRPLVFLLLPGTVTGHLAWSWDAIGRPESPLEWGATCITLGFALLAVGLVVNVRWRHHLVSTPASEH